MLIAFIADSQLGKRLYGLQDTYQDWLKAFAVCGQTVESRKPAAAIFLGDTFDAESMYPQEIHTAQKVIKGIQASGVKTYGILGNHDKGQSDNYSNIVSWLTVTGIETMLPEKPVTVEDVCLIGINHQPKHQLAKTLNQLAAPKTPSKRTILCLHQALKELGAPGMGWEVEASQIPQWITDVFLGDFHNACEFTDPLGRKFLYPGAIETVSFNQETEPGFILFDTNTLQIEHISTKQREYLKIDVDHLSGEWEQDIAQQVEKAKEKYHNKPVIQLIFRSEPREDIRLFCEGLALKVLTTEIGNGKLITQTDKQEGPMSEEAVIALAGEILPKTSLGDLGRNLLLNPDLKVLRDWQKIKHPAASISD